MSPRASKSTKSDTPKPGNAPQGADHGSLRDLSAPALVGARSISGRVDYLDDKGVCNLLKSKKLLGDDFLYAAVPSGAEDFTLTHGTYCSKNGVALNKVFCCELVGSGAEQRIVQVGKDEITLLDYLKQNGGDRTASIAVYRRAELEQPYISASAAQFQFKDFPKAPSALVAIVVIENFA